MLVLAAPELVKERREPVLAAFEPERVMVAKSPVKPVAVEATAKAEPEVKELAL